MDLPSQTAEPETGSPAAEPSLRLHRKWRSMRGYLYGLRFPALIGEVAVGSVQAGQVQAFRDAMEQIAPGIALAPIEGENQQGLVALFAAAAVGLQDLNIHPVCGPFHVSSTDQPDIWRVAIPMHNDHSARNTAAWLLMAFNRLGEHGADALDALRESIRQLAEVLAPFGAEPTNTQQTVAAAVALNVPVMRINSTMFRLGQGIHARLIESSYTDRTSTVGARLAKNKLHTAALLNDAGLPGPLHYWASSLESALDAGRKLGFPVVVKPLNRDNGVGVITGIRNEAELTRAYAEVRELDDTLLVEKHFEGRDFRITILNGRILKTEQRIAGGVTGDGSASIADLIAQRQALPHDQMVFRRRGKFQLTLDDEALLLLSELGLTPQSVLESGRRVTLRRRANISTGAEIVLVAPGSIHPDNVALALRATELLLLDFAGLDLLIPDIGVSWQESGALICEVNAQPQVSRRVTPDIFDEIVTSLVATPGRIPAHLVLVAQGSTPVPQTRIDGWMQDLGCNGLATGEGIRIAGQPVPFRCGDAWLAARTLLADTATQSALMIVPLARVLAEGLPGDWFDTIRIVGATALPPALGIAIAPHAGQLIVEPGLA